MRRTLIAAMCLGAVMSLAQSPLDEEAPWPRVRTAHGNVVTIFQPQVESWTSNSFVGRAAVSLKLAESKSESFGVVWFAAEGSVNRSNRIVTLDRLDITKVRFPDAAEGEANILAVLRDVFPAGTRTVSLDYLIDALGFSQAAVRQGARGLKHTPPEILWVTNRTVLLLIDGDPVLRPVPGGTLQRVLNTPALIVKDTSQFYVAGDGKWFAATTLEGPWSLVQTPPAEVAALTPESGGGSATAAGEAVPRILVRTHPAELLVTSGMPDFRTIRGTALQYAADTASQLFFHSAEKQAYLLISGRWFKAASLNGPWGRVVPSELPADFAKIPPGSAQAVVLASVPETPQAELALLANSVPVTATVKRSEAKIELAYDGAPKFERIPDTTMSYAVNASLPVIQTSDGYYALDDAVWFAGAAATGPWKVAMEVPEEIYTIPPESPVYYATFVSVYDATEDEVETGYTPGYLGAYEDAGTVVYGTGWDYDSWCDDEYYGWGWTWGYDYYYVPWYGWWVWRDWWDNPSGLRRSVIENIYERWGDRNVVTPHDLDSTAAAANARTALGSGGYPALNGRFKGSARPAPLRTPANTLALNPYTRPKSAVRAGEIPKGATLLTAVRQSPGGGQDLYASRDGSVYQRKSDGWYRQQAAGNWSFFSPTQGAIQPKRPASAHGSQPGVDAVQRLTPARNAGGSRAAQRPADRVPDMGREAVANEIRALEREYYARSMAQLRTQRSRPSGNLNSGARTGARTGGRRLR